MPNAFDVGRNRQRDVNVNFDVSHAVSDRVHVAAGAEWRDEQYGVRVGDPAGWEIGPYAARRFTAGSNGVFAYTPQQAGAWSRHNVAAYGDLEVFNHTDTEVTDNASGLLDGRRLAEYAYALPPSAGTSASRSASGGRACSAASATTAAGTTTTEGTGRSSIRRAVWNKASSTAGRSSTWS